MKINVVEFKKNKNLYVVLETGLLMKDPTTRDWIESVMYSNYKTYNPETFEYEDVLEEDKLKFVRPLDEFKEKFNQIPLCQLLRM